MPLRLLHPRFVPTKLSAQLHNPHQCLYYFSLHSRSFSTAHQSWLAHHSCFWSHQLHRLHTSFSTLARPNNKPASLPNRIFSSLFHERYQTVRLSSEAGVTYADVARDSCHGNRCLLGYDVPMCLIVTPCACTAWRRHWCYGKKKASHRIHYQKFPYTFCSQVGEAESAVRRCLKSGEPRCVLMTVCLLPLLHSLHLRRISSVSDYQTEKGGGISHSEHALFGSYLLACTCHARMGHAPVCQKELEVFCCSSNWSSWLSAPSKRLQHCILMSSGCITHGGVLWKTKKALLTTSSCVGWYTLNTLLAIWILSFAQRYCLHIPASMIHVSTGLQRSPGAAVEIRAEHAGSYIGIHTCLLLMKENMFSLSLIAAGLIRILTCSIAV